jgi:Skp family chaperone for outer membrane proteins
MDPTVIVALVTLLTALVGAVQGYINGQRAKQISDQAKTIDRKADEIHTLTNSALSDMTKKLEVAMQEIVKLNRQAADARGLIERLAPGSAPVDKKETP